MKSNSNKLTGWLNGTTENPIRLDHEAEPINLRAESDGEDGLFIRAESETGDTIIRGEKRSREASEEEALFIGNSDVSEDNGNVNQVPTSKKRRVRSLEDETGDDDKKKLGLNTSYDGFSIYGRILCLLVKRKGSKDKGRIPGTATDETGQQMLEGWISTQAAAEQILDDG